MKNIICSHGFGVMADSRGMFTELTVAFPDYKVVMFDYNHLLPNGDLVVSTIDSQAKLLQKMIDQQPGDSLLLCHSQGSVIAGLVDLTKISQVILLAPPVNLSLQRVIGKMLQRPGAEVGSDGTYRLPRSDGTVSLVPKQYIDSLESKNPMDLYQRIANTKPTLIIRATEDKVLGLTSVSQIRHASHVDIAAGHDFGGTARNILLLELKKFIK
ncbi:MAG: hypothetical protein ABI716_01545 [Candidatus Saccharibacteria bacterium]